ncbi:MAG: ribosome-associated translation inhibitor RaiA [Burkholderiaceae bacterium]|jgi:putative sigma-54 modulation protein|uniref:ribosome hibernation-promoting factor, HPF/YfiA family n=1 Tax=Polynucleobacter sp. MWH-Loch1C5 TaxID=2689108 RepID=UPI001C0AB2F4|nr:ribosome-associated translation inhibitor RaiA [Polynucleobacter sp. MWH-Loch1C5]MBU3542624.1 ribosome-associated translation inhibitor RaiA [Polynucleobacter sp. MWH-Loch1C5]NBU99952.1 ribosome-associated translation inhibitor RaiA [Burkholderiaceae bacterium]
MNLKLNSHHVEITPAMRSHLENKLTKIVHHFDQVISVTVNLSINNEKEKDLHNHAEISLHLKGKDLFAEAHHGDMYHAMDLAVDKLDRQVLKHKEKVQNHHHASPKNH